MSATAEALKKKLGDGELNPEILVIAICDRQLQTLDSAAATRVLGYLTAAHAWEGELDEVVELGRQIRSAHQGQKEASVTQVEKLAKLIEDFTSKLTPAQPAGQKSG
jgi:hypothetical protein